jgi:hypothetical protein
VSTAEPWRAISGWHEEAAAAMSTEEIGKLPKLEEQS